MNKDGIYAAIKQCENRIGSYNADVRTKEQEISELTLLKQQYVDIQEDAHYCLTGSRNSLYNSLFSCQTPRFLIGFCEHMQDVLYGYESAKFLNKIQEIIDTIDEAIHIRKANIGHLKADVEYQYGLMNKYEMELKEIQKGEKV